MLRPCLTTRGTNHRGGSSWTWQGLPSAKLVRMPSRLADIQSFTAALTSSFRGVAVVRSTARSPLASSSRDTSNASWGPALAARRILLPLRHDHPGPERSNNTVCESSMQHVQHAVNPTAAGSSTLAREGAFRKRVDARSNNGQPSKRRQRLPLPLEPPLPLRRKPRHARRNRLLVQVRFGDHVRFQPAGEPAVVPVGD